MPTRTLWTYKDTVDHLVDWLGATSTDTRDRRECRRATQESLLEVVNLHNWSYYQTVGRVNTVASYSTGTVDYDHAGGTYERQLTLASGTWPSSAAQGSVLISGVVYDVYDRKSDTVVTLSSNSNPGADVAASTTYTWFREAYPLPANFAKLTSDVIDLTGKIGMRFVKPGDWYRESSWTNHVGVPWAYAIVGDPNYYDLQTMRFQPAPSSARSYGFLYKRSARRLLTEEYSTGTVSVSSTTVTGSSDTAFTSDHVGCVLRISSTADAPTGLAGSNPFTEERIVTARTDANTLTIDSAFSGSYSGRKYILSDPIDIERQTMLNLFLRTAELQLATIRRPNDRGAVLAAWQKAYETSLAADSRYGATRQVTGSASTNFAQYLLTYGSMESE